MSRLQYRTFANRSPQGNPNVYFSCYPDDFGKYFEEYADKILRIQDCAIWYEAEPEADYDRDDLELNLSQMQLFVVPITKKLLTTDNRAMNFEFPLAKKRHIPVLPIMMERGLDGMYSERFGDLHYLDPNDTDKTRRSFDEVLETYIKSVLVSSELAEKVRAAFDAYVFLSYRKKDRRKAQELMRLIHRNPLCRDIAIWYDEFLTPGEGFNQAIGKMLQKSDLFALVVTPNLVNEANYVMTTEYPAAVEQGKPVLPVEMEETDRGSLDEHYKALPPCVKGAESEEFHRALLKIIRTIAVETNNEDPEHSFLIGLAYLDGIDVEVDAERALGLIKGAAEAEVPEAMEQLIMMYETGKGVARDYYEGVRWREKHVGYLRRRYKSEPTMDRVYRLINSLWELGDAHYALIKKTTRLLGFYRIDDEQCEAAKVAYSEVHSLSEQYAEAGEGEVIFEWYMSLSYIKLGDVARARGNLEEGQRYYEKCLAIIVEWGPNILGRSLSRSYDKLGDAARARGNLERAQRYYEKSLAIKKEFAEKIGTVESKKDLSVSYERIGDKAKAIGDFEGAQRYYEKWIAITEELDEETGTVESRRDLSVSYYKLGNDAREMGDLERAKRYHEKCLAIRKELAEKTGTVDANWDLSVSYDRLGDTARAMGDLEGAKRYYEKGLAIRKELAEKTGTVDANWGLSASYDSLGDTARAMGDLEGAKRYYEKSLAIRKELAEKTGTVDANWYLSVSYKRLGDTARAMGDLEGAKRYYEKSLAIVEELSEKTGTILSQRDLSVSCNKLGDIARAMGDLEGAKRYYEKSLAIAEELAKETGMLQAYRDLALILLTFGRLYCFDWYKHIGPFKFTDKHKRNEAKEMFKRVIEFAKDRSDEYLNELGKEANDILDKYY